MYVTNTKRFEYRALFAQSLGYLINKITIS